MTLIDSAKDFHILFDKLRTWEKSSWLGIPFYKLPMDAIMFQKIICEVKPDFIIETGTGKGGSSAFYASILELLGLDNSFVITIDVNVNKHMLDNMTNKNVRNRIKIICGDSINSLVIKEVEEILSSHKGKTGMAFLDSWHTKEHVLKEMEIYNKFVSVGSYLVVEDTHMNGNPVNWEWGEGPMEAVWEFLSRRSDFIQDHTCEDFLISFNPGGFLKRIGGNRND